MVKNHISKSDTVQIQNTAAINPEMGHNPLNGYGIDLRMNGG